MSKNVNVSMQSPKGLKKDNTKQNEDMMVETTEK